MTIKIIQIFILSVFTSIGTSLFKSLSFQTTVHQNGIIISIVCLYYEGASSTNRFPECISLIVVGFLSFTLANRLIVFRVTELACLCGFLSEYDKQPFLALGKSALSKANQCQNKTRGYESAIPRGPKTLWRHLATRLLCLSWQEGHISSTVANLYHLFPKVLTPYSLHYCLQLGV